VKPVLRAIQRIAFPNVCPICLARLQTAGHDLCAECEDELPEFGSPRCPSCGGTLDGALAVCSECLHTGDRPWHHAVSVLPFRGTARELVHRFKYQGHTYLAPVLATRMADCWRRFGLDTPDALVPVPLHWTRQMRRGFNQARLLAQHMGRELAIPVRGIVRRRRRTAQQAMLDFSERQSNMKGVFAMRRGNNPEGLRILLVDDVMTTGATLAAVADVLKRMKAADVCVITAARG